MRGRSDVFGFAGPISAFNEYGSMPIPRVGSEPQADFVKVLEIMARRIPDGLFRVLRGDDPKQSESWEVAAKVARIPEVNEWLKKMGSSIVLEELFDNDFGLASIVEFLWHMNGEDLSPEDGYMFSNTPAEGYVVQARYGGVFVQPITGHVYKCYWVNSLSARDECMVLVPDGEHYFPTTELEALDLTCGMQVQYASKSNGELVNLWLPYVNLKREKDRSAELSGLVLTGGYFLRQIFEVLKLKMGPKAWTFRQEFAASASKGSIGADPSLRTVVIDEPFIAATVRVAKQGSVNRNEWVPLMCARIFDDCVVRA